MKTNMNYSKADAWIVREERFDSHKLGKCEAIMSLGNGYLGLRSATEEKYAGETRDYFVAGTFNKFDKDEVTELPNAADITAMTMVINDEVFSLEQGSMEDYYRDLNLRTGELHRHVIWTSPKGDRMAMDFYRCVSLAEMHVTAAKVLIQPLSGDIHLKVTTGIDGRMTNSGSQHFVDGEKRLYEQKYMQLVQTTGQSKIDFVHNTTVNFKIDGQETEVKSRIIIPRRQILNEYVCDVAKDHVLEIQKISNVYTSRDLEMEGKTLDEIRTFALEAVKASALKGYDAIFEASKAKWEEKVWSRTPIEIESEDAYDQLALRFAQYHLEIMTPDHDQRMNIGAKGLSGEGYKGHTFWDSDIFVLPYFTFTAPEVAKKLVTYRYLSLPGAHAKAAGNHFEGAQFPWESAWLDDGEVTPVWGDADIITGMPVKIWSGFIEQHITADVAYAVWQYYMVTGDEAFMEQCGYELLMDTAKFWASRLEYSDEDGLYHINDVVGPDEYKEHVDDNAYTNYMAHWNMGKAIEYHDMLKKDNPELFAKLSDKLELTRVYPMWLDKKDKIYLPQARPEDMVIGQDRTYLSLKDIDLTKYKNQTEVRSIYKDFNQEQICHMQVSKQADIMILFFLMEHLFPMEVKRANWNYYEPRTLHDSSLSLSTHCVLAADMGDDAMAYKLFKEATEIDLGPNMKTSDDGIHTASIGGIWQCTVFGFGGVRMIDGKLRIEPKLPENWQSLKYTLYWHGQKLAVTVTKQQFTVVNETGAKAVEIWSNGKSYMCEDGVTIVFTP